MRGVAPRGRVRALRAHRLDQPADSTRRGRTPV